MYISCNPDTLQDNLGELCNSHDVKRFAVFDQFPYTDHIECGVLLERRPGPGPAGSGTPHMGGRGMKRNALSKCQPAQSKTGAGAKRQNATRPAETK